MNAQRLLDTFLELVRIDSPSREEAQVAAYCAAVLTQAGCSVHIDDSAAATGSDTGNLIAYLPARGAVDGADVTGGTAHAAAGAADATAAAGVTARAATDATAHAAADQGAPTLYFSAHMDTVSPGRGVKPIIGDDAIIRSSGDTILGGDDKAGIAVILELVRSLSENDAPHPRIGVLLSTCEELSLLGAANIDNSAFQGEPCFVLDGGDAPGYVIIGSPYHHSFTATFTGKAAHAGVAPEEGISAIVLASRAVASLELGRLDEQTTVNVGQIQGGVADNIVPEACVVKGEFRAMDTQRRQELQDEMTARIREAARAGGGSVELVWEVDYEGFALSEDDPLVQLVLTQAARLGLVPKAAFSGGGSDANFLSSRGLAPLVLGTGMSKVHSTQESLALQDLEDLFALVEAITQNF